MTLADFLLARIAEDEALARGASVKRYDFLSYADHIISSDRESTPSMDEHCDRWEPSRVLAECEAKRRIVELCSYESPNARRLPTVRAGVYDVVRPREATDEGEDILRLLAPPYADHPDYRDEWRA